MRKPSICGAYASSPCVRVRKECANTFVRVRKEFVRVRKQFVRVRNKGVENGRPGRAPCAGAPRVRVRYKPEMSATEAQLGLEFEV